MRKAYVFLAVGVLALLLTAAPVLAQGNGRIDGQVTRADGTGVGGVAVILDGSSEVDVTDVNGAYSLTAPAGEHTITFTLGDNTANETVNVTAGSTTTQNLTVDWDVSFIETITVTSASRRTERITEAPAAITTVSTEAIQREASHGQLPKLLEHSAGAEATQSGVYDFNFNTRGFNSSLNRRVLVLVDGRDPSAPFLGAQEWSSMPFPLEELESVELIRGPGSALYGADAFNGVINMVTRAPRYNQGGFFKLTGGDLSTVRGDFRYAGALGDNTFARITAGYTEGDDFSLSRNQSVEYPGLPFEAIPLQSDQNELLVGGLRLDHYFDGGASLTVDAGMSDVEGPVFVTGIGRVQIRSSERPYVRANFNTDHLNIMGYYNDRDGDQQSLQSGSPLLLDSNKWLIEAQGNTDFADGNGRLVGGISYSEEEIDSMGTLMFQPVKGEFEGVFGQIEYSLTDKLKVLLAGRYDDSNLHDSVFSPRVALVYAAHPNHTIRLNYGEAFQAPAYNELFLRAAVAPPLNALGALEAGFCTPFGVTCGLDSIPILGLGNDDLEIEEVTAYEIGYSGILGGKAFLTIDYYHNEMENFITDLITSVNPTLGRINPNFGPYQAPAGLPAPVAAQLEGTLAAVFLSNPQLAPLYAFLSNSPVDGTALLYPVSYTNFGEVESDGLEIALSVYLTHDWVLDAQYTWRDIEVKQQLPADPILLNAPENQYGLGLSYIGDGFSAAVKYRHSDSFGWNAGVFQGEVLSYDLVDLSATYQVSENIELGLNVSNLFDEDHYQIFGGDLLERRALGHIAFTF